MPADLPSFATVEHLNGILTIAAVTWLAVAAIGGVAKGVILLHPLEVADNLAARRIHTQTRLLSRYASGTVVVAGLAFILLLAGLQIALAQPIRIDDVLIVEGEWGRVEEITRTYVVLKIWDERRLVVPVGWFIDHPFQNWTRRSADILGTVLLWVDYTLPVDAVRREAQRLCEASPNWDRRVCVVQVTNASERAMQVRILVSSAASGPNFDLRCELREGLIDFVQREFPLALPQLRARMDQPARDTEPNVSLTARGKDV
jgi:small-conductance mechanosensitive channel